MQQASSSEPPATPAEDGTSRPGSDPRATANRNWVASTYFGEGFPYSVVNALPEVLFKELGANLKEIGLTALFHLPWNIKFLWGPFLDGYGTKRQWLIGVEVALTACLVALAAGVAGNSTLVTLSGIFLILAFLSATHDIAIDGFYLEALDKKDQSKFVGFRAMAYKVAMLVVSGPLLVVIGRVGWVIGMLFTAALMAALLMFHAWGLPRVERARQPISALAKQATTPATLRSLALLAAIGLAGWALLSSDPVLNLWQSWVTRIPQLGKVSLAEWIVLALVLMLLVALAQLGRARRWMEGSSALYARAFGSFLAQKEVGSILAFIILFRAGESFLLKMRYAFLRDIGMSMEAFGVASGTVGVIASFSATLLGGRLIARQGLKKWIWPFAIAQNGLHLLYTFVAWYHDHLQATGGGSVPMLLLTAVITIEAAGAGFGTAALMVYIMRCCHPDFKAAHMAILTALMSVSFTLAGVASGFLASWLGYAVYFAFTVLAALPGMLLIFRLPYLDETTAADASSRTPPTPPDSRRAP